MYKPVKNIYTIRTCPYNDNERLESLLNEMSRDGWEVYTIQEIENDEDVLYNCIFIKEVENEEPAVNDNDDLLSFKSRIERIINPELDPYELCVDIQKKIKETRQKIDKVKSLIDGTSEDSRAMLNEEISKHINYLNELKKQLAKVINPNIMEQKLGEQKITLTVSEELLDILDNDNEDNILSQIVFIRQELTEKLGYIIPKIKLEIDDSSEENEFSVKVRGIPAVKSRAYTGYTMFFADELNLETYPEGSICDKDEITGKDIVWISEDKSKDFWTKGSDATDYIARIIENTVIDYIEEIFDYSDINRYIEIVGNQNLYLIENIIPDYMSVAELKYILTNLIKEKVSIKDIVYIFEQINDFADETDKEELLARLRVSLARQIGNSVAGEDKTVYAYELSDNTLKIFETDDDSEVIRIDGSKLEKIRETIEDKNEKNEINGSETVLIAPSGLRHIIFLVLSKVIKGIRVLSREEIAPEYKLQIISEI